MADRPAFELLLSVEGREVLLAAGFNRPAGGYDVVVGVGEHVLLPHYLSVIKAVVRKCGSIKGWETVDDIRSGMSKGDETSSLPF